MRLKTGIEVGAALDLVGGVLKWLAPAFLVPAVVAIGYGEPWWSFVVAGAITGLGRARPRPDHRGRRGRLRDAARELPGRRAAVAADPDLRRAAVHPRRWPAALAPGRRVLRGGVRLHRHRRHARAADRGPRPVDAVLAPAQPLARRHGHHRARGGDPAAPADRRASAAAVRARRADGDREARADDPRDGPAAVAALRDPHPDRDPHARVPRLVRPRRPDDVLRRRGPGLVGGRARRLQHAHDLDRGVRPDHAVRDPRLHGHRGDQLPAPVPLPRAAALRRAGPGRGAPAVPRADRAGLDPGRRRGHRRRLRDRRGGRAPLALPGDGDPDHHGFRDRRLRRSGARSPPSPCCC